MNKKTIGKYYKIPIFINLLQSDIIKIHNCELLGVHVFIQSALKDRCMGIEYDEIIYRLGRQFNMSEQKAEGHLLTLSKMGMLNHNE